MDLNLFVLNIDENSEVKIQKIPVTIQLHDAGSLFN